MPWILMIAPLLFESLLKKLALTSAFLAGLALCAGRLSDRGVSVRGAYQQGFVLCPFVFVLTVPEPPAFVLQPSEVAATRWVSVDHLNIEKLDLTGCNGKQETCLLLATGLFGSRDLSERIRCSFHLSSSPSNTRQPQIAARQHTTFIQYRIRITQCVAETERNNDAPSFSTLGTHASSDLEPS